jgi:hypothetical protein
MSIFMSTEDSSDHHFQQADALHNSGARSLDRPAAGPGPGGAGRPDGESEPPAHAVFPDANGLKTAPILGCGAGGTGHPAERAAQDASASATRPSYFYEVIFLILLLFLCHS